MRLRQLWTRRLPGYSDGGIAADNGCLLTIVGDRLQCYGEDGALAWTRPAHEGQLTARLPVKGGSVYIAGPTILRIDIVSGEVLAWRDVEPQSPWLSLVDDLIVFHAELPSRLLAFDADSLAPRLQIEARVSTHLHQGLVCRSDADGEIALTDPATGAERWRWMLPRSSNGLTSHCHAGDLYCRFAGVERIAIDTRTGAIVWRVIEGDPAAERTYVHQFYRLIESTAYCGVNGLSAYDAQTGDLKWRLTDVGDIDWVPSFDGTRTALAGGRGRIYLVDLEGPAVLADHPLDRQIADVVLRGSKIFVKSFTEDKDAHELYAFEAVTA